MPSQAIAHVPAGAPPAALTFDELQRRAVVLAKSGLVPKALENNPEGIVLVGMRGAELGFSLGYSLENIDVIEGRATPNAQSRLALLRRNGHEARFVESSAERAVLKGRRRENRNDPEAWVTATFTIEDARRAELTAMWVEEWRVPPGGDRKKLVKYIVGDDRGLDDALVARAPDWASKLVEAGQLRTKDNWRKDPVSMLRARAATHLTRMEFSDVMAGYGVEAYTADELEEIVEHEVGGADVDATAATDAPAPAAEPDEEIIDVCFAGVAGCDIEGVHKHDPDVQRAADDDPVTWDAGRWRAELTSREVGLATVLKEARRLAVERGETPPNEIGQLKGRPLAGSVLDFVDSLA